MKTVLLRLEGGLALTIAWALVFLVPLRHMHRLFGVMASPAAFESLPPDPASAPVLDRARAVARRVGRVADRLPWRSSCLVRAVALRLLLERRGISGAIIRFGVRKKDKALEAHAWLILKGTILIGEEEAAGYVSLADLTPADRRTPP